MTPGSVIHLLIQELCWILQGPEEYLTLQLLTPPTHTQTSLFSLTNVLLCHTFETVTKKAHYLSFNEQEHFQVH